MKDLTEGKEGRLIFQFAVPMLLGSVFQQLYNVVDSVIVGRVIGKEALAAVGASFPIIFTLIALIIGVASGSTIVIAQFFGAKNIKNVKKTIDTLYIFLFYSSLILSAIGILLCKKIFILIKLPEEVLPQATLYLRIYLAGLITFFGFNGTSAILRGLGDSITPLYFLIMATLVNIGLDILFVMVFQWGIAGAAIATLVAHSGAFLTAIIYLSRHHKLISFNIFKMNFDKFLFKKSLHIGLPAGLQQTFVALGMLAIMGIVNLFGTDVVAAYSGAMRIDYLAMMPAMIFGQALSTFVGQNLGANKPHRVKIGLRATLLMSGVVSITITFIVVFFGRHLMGLFTKDVNVIDIGWEYLVIISSFYLVFTGMFSINGVMRGAGDTIVPMFITLFSLWVVRIPVAYFLSKEIGEVGIWWAVPIAWTVGLTLSFSYYLTGRWKLKVVVKYE